MSPVERYATPVALVALLLAGALFRSWGVVLGPTLDLWSDEARWATRLMYWTGLDFGIRPFAYMWTAQALDVFDNREFALRLPSYLASLATMVCVWAAARRLGSGRPFALLAVFCVAFHPELITFAKEFKPYSLEAFVHVALTLAALVAVQRQRFGPAFWFGAAIALPFCYNVVFLYPWLALAASAGRIRARTLAVGVGVLVLAALVAHPFVFDALGAGEQRAYWGEKYGVFPVGLGPFETVAWYAAQSWSVFTWPAALHGIDALAPAARAAFGIAYLGGVVALIAGRRWVTLGLLCGPLLSVAVANALGYWPYGAFRTNLFLIPGAALVAATGLQWVSMLRGARPLVLAGTVFVAIALWPTEPGYHRVKHYRDGAPAPQLTEALDGILQRRGVGALGDVEFIIADRHSWRPIHYYLYVDPAGIRRYAALRADAELVCCNKYDEVDVMRAQLAAARDHAREEGVDVRVWLVVTKLSAFEAVLSDPLVRPFRVDEAAYATHEPDYHPVLTELVYPSGAPR